MQSSSAWRRPCCGATRFVVFFAVVASRVISLVMFFIATVDAVYVADHLGEYVSPAFSRHAQVTQPDGHCCREFTSNSILGALVIQDK